MVVEPQLAATEASDSIEEGLPAAPSGPAGAVRPVPQMPPLFLHIGRGKSGSSTIQSLVHQHQDFMNAMGIVCPLTVRGTVNHHPLASALYAPNEDPETIQKFRADVRKNKKRKLFISAEALFSLSREGMERLKRHGGGREIRILCYVRDYPGWFQSIYAQRTKKGSNLQDFDAYFKAVRHNVSAVPRIKRWAKVFGWQAMHVRPLLPEALAGGDLITDVLQAMDVQAPPPEIEAQNVAPHWVTLELLRAMADAAKSRSLSLDPRSLRACRELIEECATGAEPRRVQYLTREQWLDLSELFRSDMEHLGKRLKVSLPVTVRDPPERAFLPDISTVPTAVKAAVREKSNEPDFRTRTARPVHELLQTLLK